ncbi:hypothetical protein N7448_005218 [Penicillium atrosanguineum]|uniref:Arabinan endo-1,5-alpha-L-arabinosidase n=1 Tax=Penicillium atrosanguineum TaxID=1132637 RepID=A0A9W9U054_9EURO|nr:Autophagy-related protein 13 [Penicillium atrosanguineum]KAJ5125906.1 hypothetical protein N7526_008083 [Penicillium atrosanguineum]KAJ5136664.1 hypothetical protein N7448_005218 [Penicillium atrosanguineum]KAJ5292996.1 Autophagy-related protein 13 [Penicillium atrosanguineum]KAJ5302967.1 hypothetical protein N7476_009766 [Penicillium atrosanguineum]
MFALFFFFIALACAYPNRGACTGDCWTHDPSMIQRKSDGKYFRFATGTGVNTMTSPSVKGPWTDVGSALPNGSSITVSGVSSSDIWAPDVHYQNNQYYMYYVLSQIGTQNSEIGVATSKTMEPGSWTDHGSVGIPANSEYNRIDPNWIEIDGKNYLNFGSFWQDIHQIEMETPLKVGSSAAYQLSYNATLNHREEGSFMFKNGDFYYLLYSDGIAGRYTATYPAQGEEYHIMVCRSTTGTGGFVDKDGTACTNTGGSLLLASHGQVYGPGGQGVVNDNDLGLVMYYHYYPLATKEAGGKGNAGYMYSWNELGWENGWPYVKAT